MPSTSRRELKTEMLVKDQVNTGGAKLKLVSTFTLCFLATHSKKTGFDCQKLKNMWPKCIFFFFVG